MVTLLAVLYLVIMWVYYKLGGKTEAQRRHDRVMSSIPLEFYSRQVVADKFKEKYMVQDWEVRKMGRTPEYEETYKAYHDYVEEKVPGFKWNDIMSGISPGGICDYDIIAAMNGKIRTDRIHGIPTDSPLTEYGWKVRYYSVVFYNDILTSHGVEPLKFTTQITFGANKDPNKSGIALKDINIYTKPAGVFYWDSMW